MAAVCVAAFTGFVSGMGALAIHLIAGVSVAALVGARIVWGLLGSTHARFADFAYPPQAVLAHVRALLVRRQDRHLGHNPLGAMMVFAFLAALLLLAAAGAVALGGMFKQGPLGAFVSVASGRAALSLHQALAWALLAMIAAHLAGVAFESWRERENLVRAMLTGRKRAGQGASAALPRRSRPVLAAGLIAGLGGAAAGGIAALAAIPPPHLPPAELDPAYDGACGSCHYAFSPSLNPAPVWNAILDRLDRHFGTRVRLPAQQVQALRTYLTANAAGRWDTLAAKMFRIRDPAQPLRVTATPYWRHVHAGIPAAVFAERAVSGRLSCNACHADADTGRFAPQAIALPDGS